MTTVSVSIPCRAKDPATCKYHSAQQRADRALAEGRIDDYLTAQVELAAAIKTTPEVVEFFRDLQTTKGGFAPANNPKGIPQWRIQAFENAAKGFREGREYVDDMRVLREEAAEANAGFDTRKLTVQVASLKAEGEYYQYNYQLGGGKFTVDPSSIQQVDRVEVPVEGAYRYQFLRDYVGTMGSDSVLNMLSEDVESGRWETPIGRTESIRVVKVDQLDEADVAEYENPEAVAGYMVVYQDATNETFYEFPALKYKDGHIGSPFNEVHVVKQNPVMAVNFVPHVTG